MAQKKSGTVGPQKLERPIALIVEAIDLIDAFDGPPEAAVHLELALQALRRARKN